MLYPEGKSGKKRIADDMMELIEKSFNLPRGWMDMLADSKVGAADHLEFAGNVRAGFVPVIGEAVLGVDGSVDMIEFRSGWLSIYSGDKDAYGLKVKGDSMWPRIQSGEYVVIEPNTPVHPGDEVFVRTKDGHNMIKIMNKTRDGDYQFSSINSDHRPITLPVEEVDKMHFVSAIVKHTRYVDQDDLPKF
nr:S24 family peptidase [Escherichia coli]